MPVFEISNARKAFGELEVLKGVSLRIEQGEVVSVIGPSGGGKSTLLRCATLLETLDAGALAYGETVCAREENGRSIYEGKAALRQARRKFGLVFQQFDLFPHYTVLKNVCDAPVCGAEARQSRGGERGGGAARQDGTKGKGKRLPLSALGRTAAACGHRPRARDEAGHTLFRRADLRARSAAHGRSAARHPFSRRREHDDAHRDARDALCPRRERPRRLFGRRRHRGAGKPRAGLRRPAAGADERSSCNRTERRAVLRSSISPAGRRPRRSSACRASRRRT